MPFPQLAASALSCLEISEPLTSKKGQKYCNIFFNGEQPLWQLSSEALYSPWQAGVYQKDSATETRQNLDLHLIEEARKTLEGAHQPICAIVPFQVLLYCSNGQAISARAVAVME